MYGRFYFFKRGVGGLIMSIKNKQKYDDLHLSLPRPPPPPKKSALFQITKNGTLSAQI